MCDCEFDSDPDDPFEDGTPGNESWHYMRKCHACGSRFWSLRCPHDLNQRPCTSCGVTPEPLEEPTND